MTDLTKLATRLLKAVGTNQGANTTVSKELLLETAETLIKIQSEYGPLFDRREDDLK